MIFLKLGVALSASLFVLACATESSVVTTATEPAGKRLYKKSSPGGASVDNSSASTKKSKDLHPNECQERADAVNLRPSTSNTQNTPDISLGKNNDVGFDRPSQPWGQGLPDLIDKAEEELANKLNHCLATGEWIE
jgi:hypothetical protein